MSELNNPTAKFPSPSPPSAPAPPPHDDGGSAEHSLALTGPEPAMLREGPGSLEALWVMGYLSRRTDIVADLKEQISELTVIIEQMNRDHRSAQKLVSDP